MPPCVDGWAVEMAIYDVLTRLGMVVGINEPQHDKSHYSVPCEMSNRSECPCSLSLQEELCRSPKSIRPLPPSHLQTSIAGVR